MSYEQRYEILKLGVEARNKATSQLHEWVQFMMGTATAALTAMIALQQNFVPENVANLWLLQAGWGLLASAIFFGAVFLRSQSHLSDEMADKLLQAMKAPELPKAVALGADIPWWGTVAKAAFPIMLALGCLALTAFAITNVRAVSAEKGMAISSAK